MLALQIIFTCQIVISTTESLKRKASKYVLATFKGQRPNKCPMGVKNIKSYFRMFPPHTIHRASVTHWQLRTEKMIQLGRELTHQKCAMVPIYDFLSIGWCESDTCSGETVCQILNFGLFPD